ncbi:hypothetical protein FB45DRAFT_222174 [Roridomyces roridus]|uniref:Uncharacterized protein n=1 Tax=Roridomyces roridus TaxID=1738132 RepID=A0AAD7BCF5_9AGAR|nr:hypothetical protein FB45DRAFT_222174 [Roridomyces roridus]
MPRDDNASGTSSPRRIKRQVLDKKRRYDSDGRPLARTLASHGPTARALEQRLEALPPQESISAPVMTRIKVKSEPVSAPTPSAATPDYGWRHPDELPYISDGVGNAGWNDAAIMHFVSSSSAFSIPERTERTDPWVRVLVGDEEVVLPRGYRIPLMWASYFLWTSVRLILTAAPDIRRQEWEQARWEILHLARLCAGLFDAAREAVASSPMEPTTLSGRGGNKARMGGMPRTWRHPPFDRVLLRHHREWLVMRDKYVELFWNDYQEEEFVNFDMVKLPWDTWVIKDHKGFKLTKEHVVSGLSASELMAGFWIEDNGARFGWNEGTNDNLPFSDVAPSAIFPPSDTHPTPLTRVLPVPIVTHNIDHASASLTTPSSSSTELPPRIPLPRERRKMRLAALAQSQNQNQVTKSEKEVSLPPATKNRVLWDEIPRQMQRQQSVVVPPSAPPDEEATGNGAIVDVPVDKSQDVEMAEASNAVLKTVNPESAYPTPEAESEPSRATSVDVLAVRTKMGSVAPGHVAFTPIVAGSEGNFGVRSEEPDVKMEGISAPQDAPDDDDDDDDSDLELLYPDPSPEKPATMSPRASSSPGPVAMDWGAIASTSSLASSRSASLASLPPLSIARFPDPSTPSNSGSGESESLSTREPLFVPAMVHTYQLTRSPLRVPLTLPTDRVVEKRSGSGADADVDVDLLARCERLTAEAARLRAELKEFRERSGIDERIRVLESQSSSSGKGYGRHPLAHLMVIGEEGEDEDMHEGEDERMRMAVDNETGDVPPR